VLLVLRLKPGRLINKSGKYLNILILLKFLSETIG